MATVGGSTKTIKVALTVDAGRAALLLEWIIRLIDLARRFGWVTDYSAFVAEPEQESNDDERASNHI